MQVRFRGGNMGVQSYPATTSKTTPNTSKPEQLFEKALDPRKLAIGAAKPSKQ